MHRLLRKTSMDAVNEALLKETEYPAADKDYKNPWFFKGTEPDLRTGSKKTAFPWTKKPEYQQLCSEVIESLHSLSDMTKNPDIKACATMSAGDLEYFMQQETTGKTGSRRRRAAIKMHEEPKHLPPRPELRSHLDEELKEEMDAETAVPVKHYKRFAGAKW